MHHHQIDRIAEDLFVVVPQLHRIMDSGVRRELSATASVPQLRLLTELMHGPQSMSALARQQHVSPQAICDLVHDLVERGWLARAPHPHDRRQQILSITEAGQDAFAQAQLRALHQLTPLLTALSDAELTVVAAALPVLQRVLNLVDRAGHAAG